MTRLNDILKMYHSMTKKNFEHELIFFLLETFAVFVMRENYLHTSLF